MSYKVLIFIVIQFIPLIVWFYLLKKKEVKVDWRLIASYFIFGSWFEDAACSCVRDEGRGMGAEPPTTNDTQMTVSRE